MSKLEQAAAKAELTPLSTNSMIVAPVLTPIAVAFGVGIIAGAVVGYVETTKHASQELRAHDGTQYEGDIRAMSIGDLLQARQDTMAA